MFPTDWYVVNIKDNLVFCKVASSFFDNKGFLDGGLSESLP